MRIWDIKPKHLCQRHLLGEHRELHGLWNILVKHKGDCGYARHPETKRWRGKTAALYLRHEKLVVEMKRRGYRHWSALDRRKARGRSKQNILLNIAREQKEILKKKKCGCFNEKII